MKGDLAVIADEGLTTDAEPALWIAAQLGDAPRLGVLVRRPLRDTATAAGATGSAIAFPLVCRDRPIGALVGLDPVPSAAVPALGRVAARWRFARCSSRRPSRSTTRSRSRSAEAVSVTDDLTGLYNSRYLNLVLRREAKRASRSGRPLSLLFLDLDGFKQVNDTHGHLAGSKALVEAGGDHPRQRARNRRGGPVRRRRVFRDSARYRQRGRGVGGRAYPGADRRVRSSWLRTGYPSI